MIFACGQLGFEMIHEIDIKNFRCFEHLTIPECSRINVIVGDNGAGKTALLEAIYLALSGAPEWALRMRNQRGHERQFQGGGAFIDKTLWAGYFYGANMSNSISIKFTGTGAENRSLRVYKGLQENVIPLNSESPEMAPIDITFEWVDAAGKPHIYSPKIRGNEIAHQPLEEILPGYYWYPASHYGNSRENAARFSELSKEGNHHAVVDAFKSMHGFIEDISVEDLGGFSALFAKIKGVKRKIPLNDISGGITRSLAIQLAILQGENGVICVDEIENGIYFSHMESHIEELLESAVKQQTQLFLSTHSEEWLNAFSDASNRRDIDISLWRIERDDGRPSVRQFTGKDLAAGLEFGDEVR